MRNVWLLCVLSLFCRHGFLIAFQRATRILIGLCKRRKRCRNRKWRTLGADESKVHFDDTRPVLFQSSTASSTKRKAMRARSVWLFNLKSAAALRPGSVLDVFFCFNQMLECLKNEKDYVDEYDDYRAVEAFENWRIQWQKKIRLFCLLMLNLSRCLEEVAISKRGI